MPNISPQAIIEEGAQLARGVRVGPFSYLGPQVRIGPDCTLENNVTILGDTVLGEKNHVFPMAVLGTAPVGSGTVVSCRIGNANAIREHVTIYGGASSPTRIGTDNLLMIDCTVGAGAVVGDHCIFANVTHIGAGTRMADCTHTSGFAAIADGVTVGAYTFIAGYAGVDRDAPCFAILQGSPFRVRGVNTHKLRRCGFGDDDIRALKDAFRELFNGQTEDPDPAGLERLRRQKELNPCVRRLLEALERRSGEGTC